MVDLEIHTKKIVRVRIEYSDGTFIELDDQEECKKWHEMSLSQATNAYLHGYRGPTLKWKEGEISDQDGFVRNGKMYDCGHMRMRRYCGVTDVEGGVCICDEPPE